jgi:dimethylamine/trimethylamine dehydrogenase
VLTPEQLVLEGKEAPGDRVVVYDCEGYFMGVNLAEQLAREGKHVTYLTPNAHPGAYMHFTGEAIRLHALLHELHVELVTQRLLDRVAPGELTTMNAWVEGDVSALAADSVVLVTQRLSNDALYRELEADPDALEREGVEAVYRAGDCVAPRLIADCVFDGHRLARELDSPSPQTPLPFIRERRLVGDSSDAVFESQLARPRETAAV